MRGVERVFSQQKVGAFLQPGAHARTHGQGQVGGLHALARAHEQLVVKQGAQAGEGVAHGRLPDEEALGRTPHMALGQQGVKSHQQVQVQLAEIGVVDIDVVHDIYPFNRFP